MKGKILVIGASGTQGYPTATELLKRGFGVRAFDLKENGRILGLKGLGAETFYGNLLDGNDVFQAMQGMDGVFFVPAIPSSADPAREIQVGKNVVSAAMRAGVPYMVHTSVDRAGEHESFVRWGRDFWPGYDGYWRGKAAVIDLVKNSTIPHWTILKPAYMMDCFIPPKVLNMYPELKSGRLTSARLPETRVSMMCGDDLGQVAAEAFERFEDFEGKEIPLAGDRINMEEAAAAISAATGKTVTAISCSREELLKNGNVSSVIDAEEWDNENGYTADVAASNRWGVKLSTFREWCERHRDEFVIGT